ncbi:MAG TPA: hypothetical protein VLA76_01905 [Candidatus Angelobacter sp.]|nr:hypothetical protein [Candidatus Angelobacter sp.]
MARRTLAWGLVLYGLAGIALLVIGAAIGLDTAGRLERLASDADGTLAAAVRSTDAAADAFTDVDASLEEAELSAGTAALLSREAAGTLRSLALAMELSIFGAQPLLPLSAEFETSAGQADELAEALDRVGGSLGDTRGDVDTLGVELRTLSERIEALRGSSGDDADGAPPLRLFIGLLVAWLTLPALAAIAVGLAMLRRPRPLPPVD